VDRFTCFWSTATGWGVFSTGPGLEIKVLHGSLPCQSCEFPRPAIEKDAGTTSAATLDGKALDHRIERSGSRAVFRFAEPLMLVEGSFLRLSIHTPGHA
jgi:hypothetical protein